MTLDDAITYHKSIVRDRLAFALVWNGWGDALTVEQVRSIANYAAELFADAAATVVEREKTEPTP